MNPSTLSRWTSGRELQSTPGTTSNGLTQVRWTQTQEERIFCRLEFPPEDGAAHRQVGDRRRTCASEKVAVGCLRSLL